MKPEEYPSETFCKYTNIVTGVLENFERIANVVVRTRSIYAMIIRVNLVHAVASCGGFLANLRCGGCFGR